jgi:hypothetical protein
MSMEIEREEACRMVEDGAQLRVAGICVSKYTLSRKLLL